MQLLWYCISEEVLCRVFLVRIFNLYALMAGWLIATEVFVCVSVCVRACVCISLSVSCEPAYVHWDEEEVPLVYIIGV